ncbi:phospholipase [Streptomyces microflavus]|uniref:phospholipase n=1 Tax=Streptomyces microflavus TaxID=1919 RepID=UPI0036B16FB4
MRRRSMAPLAAAAAAVALSLPLTLITAASASAAPSDKPQVLSSWTQTSASSYNAWNAARNNQGAWSAYGFDWSTDYCSSSPDNPFGFPFQTACARHDFGYRNHKAAGTFSTNKARVDSAFYEDLKRVCAAYSGAKRTSCNSTAWTYYHAVDIFGIAPAGADSGRPAQAA